MDEELQTEVTANESMQNDIGEKNALMKKLKERFADSMKRNNEKKEKEKTGKRKGISIKSAIALTFTTLSLLTYLTTLGYFRDFEADVVTTVDVADTMLKSYAEEIIEDKLNITIGEVESQYANIQDVSNIATSLYDMVKAYIGREDLSLEEMNNVLALNGADTTLLEKEDGTPINLAESLETANADFKSKLGEYNFEDSIETRASQIGKIALQQNGVESIVETCKIVAESIYANTLRNENFEDRTNIESYLNDIVSNSQVCKNNSRIISSVKANIVLEYTKEQIGRDEFDELLSSRGGRKLFTKIHEMGGFVGKIADSAYDTFGPLYDVARETVAPFVTEFLKGAVEVDSKLDKRVDTQDEIG